MTDVFGGAAAEGPGQSNTAADLEELVRNAYRSAAHTVRPEDLRRTSPMLTAGSVPRPRRINMLIPFAAAAAVIAAVGASVAVPRLLTGSTGSGSGSPGASATQGISTHWPGHYPPFQVVLTIGNNNRESALLVESAATGHVLSSVSPPQPGDMWVAVSATRDAAKFVVAAAPSSSPYRPTWLYTLTLSARGTATGLAPLAGSPLPGLLLSMAASADGSMVAYTAEDLGGGYTYDVGVLSGGKTRQWTVSNVTGMAGISVSGNGSMLTFFTSGLPGRNGVESALWSLPTSAAPGSAAGVARKLRDYTWVGGRGHAMTIADSALLSPDGSEVFVSTTATAASGKAVTRVTAYSTADGASLGMIASWDNGSPTEIIPVGGLPLVCDPSSFEAYGKGDSTAYLLDPATKKRTTLQLRGIPRGQDYVDLAW